MSFVGGVSVVIPPEGDVPPAGRMVIVFGHAKHGPMSACVVLALREGDTSPMLNPKPLKNYRGHLRERCPRVTMPPAPLGLWSAGPIGSLV